MGTAVAYLHHPKWKALVLSLPIPFTLANLSLAQDVNATHVVGLLPIVAEVGWIPCNSRVIR
jgi:hypothetical protein